jgi:hypothetical protein
LVCFFAGCSQTPAAQGQGWVNLALGESQVRASASFSLYSQACDIAEIADCVVARCRPMSFEERIAGGVVTLSWDGADITLDTDPSRSDELEAYVSETVDAAVEPGTEIAFSVSRSNTAPPVSRELRAPQRLLVDQCAAAEPGTVPLVESGSELELSWSSEAVGELLIRLVPLGQSAAEPHIRPSMVAICQVPAESSGITIAAQVTELFEDAELELHADLITLSLADTEQRTVAFSISRDACRRER